ncbi:DNA topoisomerase-3 [Dethiosulfatibacter aminovorans DSM 17477]|uniref:DNA topoisomerase 3 n=1 Tax=Dethiosulfatibacter aminovorans DSM 17477 TaxID=1121476 RepID=A0A1M6I2G9_9FIRM|nr:DNA topoisomerase 3 [Dethiosulfatibacter aminovorans]SHJ28679.1 DNA topoisomerase-3 [Dethiosulfatibacter aminovorans DSM 17477]
MGKKLVLAEKPSVGKEIAKVLGCRENRNGYMEGKSYLVTWALGHLVTLADPDAYNKKYAQWHMEDLPIIPDRMKLVVIKKSGKQFNTVKSLMERNDVDEIIIATDAGREGELVARWILEKTPVKKTVKRLWISSVTKKAITEGFNKLKPGKDYQNLYSAAVARAESDWIVGINATRALTTKYNAQLSCGRVQTPTVAIIAQREKEIREFQPQKYYGMKAEASNLDFIWKDEKSNNSNTFKEETIDSILNRIKNKDGKVISVDSKMKKKYSPPLYDLTELQRDGYSKYGYSAKKTLSIMQSLYEHHKLLTYPRTDSRYLTDDMVDTLPDVLKAISLDKYRQTAFGILKKPVKKSKSFVDNSKVSDHHAIIPTEESMMRGSLSYDENNIYELVVKRFLSVLLPPYEYEEKTVKMEIGGEIFTTTGIKVISMGWKSLSPEDSMDKMVPDFKNGDSLKIKKVVKTTGETSPPPYFNEGTLLSAMENPVKYMSTSDKDLKKIIGETGGLGTVATRADIIDKLFNTQLIEEKGKSIRVTNKGKQLLSLVPDDLKSPLLTADWEKKLDLISKGKLDKNAFIMEMKGYTRDLVKDIKGSTEKFKYDNLSTTKCPECGKLMLEVKTKHGKSLVCQDRNCGHRINISRTTNARCPNCHKKLDLVGKDDNQKFVCPNCGYRETLASFEKKKKNQSSKGGKRDFQNYKKKAEKAAKEAEMADNPFAALAKLNLNKNKNDNKK